MCTISNYARSVSDSETSGEDRDFADSFTGKDYYEDLIDRANFTPLPSLFRYYGLRVDEHNRKIVCPFPTHKGGREYTPSFLYYPKTNTFWCFGCKAGTRATDFVSFMHGINKLDAAYKILDLFDSQETIGYDRFDSNDKLGIMMDFSNAVREFREACTGEASWEFIEIICSHCDAINKKLKDKLTVEALRSVVNQLQNKIELYKLREKI